MKEYKISHLVKSEDLNHHGTLFAGRASEWLVEAAFICAAAQHGKPENVLCVNIHGFTFKRPVPKGDILTIYSQIAKVGKTSITVYVHALSEIGGLPHVNGFLTFVCVDSESRDRIVHGLVMDEPAGSEEVAIRERAELLQKN